MLDRLLTTEDVRILLGLQTAKATLRIMAAWGVPFIHLGRGRGKGMRWKTSRVIAAINERERDPGIPVADWRAKPRRKPEGTFPKTLKEALALSEKG